MGLLDIWQDWKNDNIGQPIEEVAKSSQYATGLNSRLDTAGGVPETKSSNILDPRNYGYSGRMIGRNTTNFPISKSQAMSNPANVSAAMNSDRPGFPLKNEGEVKLGINEEQSKKFFGMSLDEIKSNWKDKGGFDGLMANPAFTLGLAIMQSSAQGKRIDEKILDNFVQAAGISNTFQKKIKDAKQVPIQATSADIAEVKSLLETMNIEKPNVIERIVGKVQGKNVSAMFDIAAEDIAIELQKEMQRLQDANKTGKPLVFDTRRKLKIIERLVKEGKFKKKGGIPFVTSATLESDVKVPTREHGGPVQEGKPYVVGEAGPEVVIPTSDGNVLSNDDSQIFAMLLASNPQLQKVSKQRAERILRARFPEYFE